MAKTLHFESFPAYKRWLAAGHIHHLFRHHGGKGTPTIKIQGKLYKPQHGNPAELVIFGNPNRGRRAGRSNPHKPGCQCALCKNARGEKHAAGCKCAICNRGVRGNSRGRNGSGGYSEMLRALRQSYESKLRAGMGKHEAAKAALRESTAGSKVKQDFLSEVNMKNPKRRRKNQDGSGEEMTQAVQLYEAFQGKDADKVIERTVSDEIRHNYVALGKLVAVGTGECNVSAERLVSQYDHQSRIDFEGDGVILACSPDGAQLYFIGGRQKLDSVGLNRLTEDPSKDIFDLGECGWVVYAAQKAPDFESVKYVHKFGEESKDAETPRLIYDGIREQFSLAGGEYHVDAPGIIN
jgi:hypothetical protein